MLKLSKTIPTEGNNVIPPPTPSNVNKYSNNFSLFEFGMVNGDKIKLVKPCKQIIAYFRSLVLFWAIINFISWIPLLLH